MSNFNNASLIVTPNSVKAGKLYSIKPTNGAGDLDVVRATTATYVGADGLIKTALANVPRLDYTNGSCPSILVEPQRTNLVLRSEEFDVFPWIKSSVTITPNITTAPDGTLTADKIIPTTTLNTHFIRYSTASLIGVVVTNSIYAKASEYNSIRVGTNAGAGIGATFNLLTGVISNNTAIGAFIDNVGNGWYRCTVTGVIGSVADIFVIDNSGTNTFSGNDTNGLFIWGAQLEAGSNATSYIPTTTSTVTRNADVISKSGLTGITTITETFENGTTNIISGNPTSYTMSQGRIKNVIGL